MKSILLINKCQNEELNINKCINISSASITGNENINSNSPQIYTITNIIGSLLITFYWVVLGGVIISGQNSNSITANFNQNGFVYCIINNCENNVLYTIEKQVFISKSLTLNVLDLFMNDYIYISCLNATIKLYENNILVKTLTSNNNGEYQLNYNLILNYNYNITQTCLNKTESDFSNSFCLGIGNDSLMILVKKNDCQLLKEGLSIEYLIAANIAYACNKATANALAYYNNLSVAQTYVNNNGKCVVCTTGENCDCNDVSLLQLWQNVTGKCNITLNEKIKVLMQSQKGCKNCCL